MNILTKLGFYWLSLFLLLVPETKVLSSESIASNTELSTGPTWRNLQGTEEVTNKHISELKWYPQIEISDAIYDITTKLPKDLTNIIAAYLMPAPIRKQTYSGNWYEEIIYKVSKNSSKTQNAWQDLKRGIVWGDIEVDENGKPLLATWQAAYDICLSKNQDPKIREAIDKQLKEEDLKRKKLYQQRREAYPEESLLSASRNATISPLAPIHGYYLPRIEEILNMASDHEIPIGSLVSPRPSSQQIFILPSLDEHWIWSSSQSIYINNGIYFNISSTGWVVAGYFVLEETPANVRCIWGTGK